MNKTSLFTKWILTLSFAASVLSSRKEFLHRKRGSAIMSMKGSHTYDDKTMPRKELTFKAEKHKARSPLSLGWIGLAFKNTWPLD